MFATRAYDVAAVAGVVVVAVAVAAVDVATATAIVAAAEHTVAPDSVWASVAAVSMVPQQPDIDSIDSKLKAELFVAAVVAAAAVIVAAAALLC